MSPAKPTMRQSRKAKDFPTSAKGVEKYLDAWWEVAPATFDLFHQKFDGVGRKMVGGLVKACESGGKQIAHQLIRTKITEKLNRG